MAWLTTWGPFLVFWLLGAVWPVPAAAPLPAVAGKWAISLAFCVATLLLARRLPAVTSWRDLGITWPRSRRPPSAAALIFAGAIAYVAAQWLSHQVTNALVAATNQVSGGEAAFSVPDRGEIPADVVRSFYAGTSEELLVFGMPFMLGALYWRKVDGDRPGASLRRALILACAAAPLLLLRVGGHLYWGPAVLAVGPWLVGSLLILRLFGSLWPLVAGHIIYDLFSFILPRLDYSQWLVETYSVTLYVGTLTLFGLGIFLRPVWPQSSDNGGDRHRPKVEDEPPPIGGAPAPA